MKIAIFHDYFGVIGGAEKLVLTLARALGADVITTDTDNNLIKKMEFEDVKIISIGKSIKRPILKQLSTCVKFASCNFRDDYDLFIFSGNWTHFAAKRHKPNIYYCHTPVKAFYERNDWLKQESFLVRIFFKLWVLFHKPLYEYYMNHVQTIVANSSNTQLKIRKYLHRDDNEVIYPPVDCARFRFQEIGNFWLSVNRFYPEKRIELQIEAFRCMPDEKLVVVGSFTEGDYASKYAERIKHSLSKNVEVRDAVTEKELIDLYSKCKGFISTAKDEDFGMAAVEAMASGKPVVCVREGGYTESIVDNITGLLVDPTVEGIVQAVKTISKDPQKYQHACQKQAKKFDIAIFIKCMKEKIQSHLILTYNSSQNPPIHHN